MCLVWRRRRDAGQIRGFELPTPGFGIQRSDQTKLIPYVIQAARVGVEPTASGFRGRPPYRYRAPRYTPRSAPKARRRSDPWIRTPDAWVWNPALGPD